MHVVSKTNSKEHLTLPANTVHLPPLAHGDIRLQTRLISLTANNLSYARLGHIANWWDAFPVPQFLPAPYNDIEKYGIVPTWGYAEIIESRIDGLTEGTIVYGFWPSSTLPVDLQLVPAKPEGHYIDMTSRRHRLWSYYHRYTIPRQPVDLTSQTLAAQTVFKPLFECAHTLNTYVLGLMAVHPCPRTLSDEEWSHADLSATAVISLSASGKTARAFNDALLNNRKPDTGPLGLLAITTDPSSLMLTQRNHTSSTQTKTLSYPSSLTSETITFLNTLAAQKILLVDFGGRADSPPPRFTSTCKRTSPPSPSESSAWALRPPLPWPKRRNFSRACRSADR